MFLQYYILSALTEQSLNYSLASASHDSPRPFPSLRSTPNNPCPSSLTMDTLSFRSINNYTLISPHHFHSPLWAICGDRQCSSLAAGYYVQLGCSLSYHFWWCLYWSFSYCLHLQYSYHSHPPDIHLQRHMLCVKVHTPFLSNICPFLSFNLPSSI